MEAENKTYSSFATKSSKVLLSGKIVVEDRPSFCALSSTAIAWTPFGSPEKVAHTFFLRDIISASTQSPSNRLVLTGWTARGPPQRSCLACSPACCCSCSCGPASPYEAVPADLELCRDVAVEAASSRTPATLEYSHRAQVVRVQLDCPSADEAAEWEAALTAALPRWREPAPTLLAFVNPVGGSGRGACMLARLQKKLEGSGVTVEMVQTKHMGHAIEIAHEIALGQYVGWVGVGGDGLLCEILNGLRSRSDWATASRMPFTCLPAGTDNAMSISLGIWQPADAAMAIRRRLVMPLDLLHIRNRCQLREPSDPSPLEMVSCCTCGWGIVAKVARRAADLRQYLGTLRIVAAGAEELFSSLKPRKLRVSFVRSHDSAAATSITSPASIRPLPRCTGPRCPSCALPPARAHQPQHKGGALDLNPAHTSGSHAQSPVQVQCIPPAHVVLPADLVTSEDVTVDVSSAGEHPENQGKGAGPDSSEWEVIEGEYHMAFAFNQRCSTSRAPAIAPDAHFADGVVTVLLIKMGSLLEALRFLAAMQMGTCDVLEPTCQYIRCSQVRFETDEPTDFIIDGEQLRSSHVEVTKLPRQVQAMCPL